VNGHCIPCLSVALLILSYRASAQEWHKEALPFCSQIKAKGAKVSYRPLSVFEAPTPDNKCCEALNLMVKGTTERFGYFKLSGLAKGRYFISLDLKTKRVVVPILFDRALNIKDCEPTSRITVDKATDQVSWEDWVVVD
jgi:hypothetical protein